MRYTDLINLARNHAAASDHKVHQVVAIALKGGAIQAIEVNQGVVHAEARALKRASGATTLLVYRFNARDRAAVRSARASCPCGNCAKLIKRSAIRRVVLPV